MEIIYKKEKWFGNFLMLFEKKQNLLVREAKKHIPRKEYYDVVMSELEKLNNFVEEKYDNKIIEVNYNIKVRKLEFRKTKNVAIKQAENFIIITLEEEN